MDFFGFLHFSLYLEAAATLATITLHASLGWPLATCAKDCILPAINIRKHLGVSGSHTTTLKTLLAMTLSNDHSKGHPT
jgi:hypothetical protein